MPVKKSSAKRGCLLALSLTAGVCVSCTTPHCDCGPADIEDGTTIPPSWAIELAKQEFARTGWNLGDYRISAVEDPTEWIIVFDVKGKRLPVGERHLVTVDKADGKTQFMKGQ